MPTRMTLETIYDIKSLIKLLLQPEEWKCLTAKLFGLR
jgi:hypothetical protein